MSQRPSMERYELIQSKKPNEPRPHDTATNSNIMTNSEEDDNIAKQNLNERTELRHHSYAVIVIICYIPIVVVPWIATAYLSHRPFSRKTYYDQEGFDFEEIHALQSWATAIDVLNSIASLLAVPITSFVLAQVAVIFSQGREPARQLSVRQLFALADRAWTDIVELYKAFRWREPGSGRIRVFLALAASLLLVSGLQQPLYQLLVDWRPLNVPSGIVRRVKESETITINYKDWVVLGRDIEPAQMAMIPQAPVLKRVQSDLAAVSLSSPQQRLWLDYNSSGVLPSQTNTVIPERNSLGGAQLNEADSSDAYSPYTPRFVASIPINSTTGVLRQHIMRFNSSITCERVDTVMYPTQCPGLRPFTTSISFQNDSRASEFRVCAPGEWGQFPWNFSRNRLDLEENVFLRFADLENNTTSIVRCSTTTTRGYFELGNYRNMQTYGPLLQKWPSPEVMERDFNDKFVVCRTGDLSSCNTPYPLIPTEYDTETGGRLQGPKPDDPEHMRWNASGPLMTAVMALFGNDSWFATAANVTSTNETGSKGSSAPLWWKPLCERKPLHLSSLVFEKDSGECELDKRPMDIVAQWISAWNPWNDTLLTTETFLFTGMFFTHEAILAANEYPWAERNLQIAGRTINTSPGFIIFKPDMSLGTEVGISVLIALQALGLIWCAFLIARARTWTRVFNAMAMARIGSGLSKDQLPANGSYAGNEDYERLKNTTAPLCTIQPSSFTRAENPRRRKPNSLHY